MTAIMILLLMVFVVVPNLIDLAGGAYHRISGRHERPPLTGHTQPICGCGHHRSYHDKPDGPCRTIIKTPVRWDYYMGEPVEWIEQPCTCQQYVGPVPMEPYYVLPPSVEAPDDDE